MPQREWLVLISIGGLFLLIGLGAIFWNRKEEKSYFDALSTRSTDFREFLDHWPPRPQFGALKIGGLITIAVGVVMLVAGVVIRLWD